MKKYYFTALAFVLLPAISFAQCASTPNSINLNASSSNKLSDIVCYVIGIINILTPILFALAFIVFFWGLSKYVLGAGDSKVLKQGQQYMMWGVLALFILFSYQAIIGIAAGQLDFASPNVKNALLP